MIKNSLDEKVLPVISPILSPKSISRLATIMPLSINQKLVEKILNATFKEQIGEGDFDFLQDRQLQIEIIDANLFIGLSFNNQRITCTHFASSSYSADATLSVDSYYAIQLAQQEVDPDTLFFQRKLKIKGDTELAHHVKNTIDTLDPNVIPQFLLKLIGIYKQNILEPVNYERNS